MKPLTLEAVRADPGLIAAVHRRARRARSEAISNALVRLVHRLTPRLSLRRLGTHWG